MSLTGTAILASGCVFVVDQGPDQADLAARRIDSSGTRADFLIETMSYFLPGRAQEAYFDAVESIQSAGSRACVLHAVLDLELDGVTFTHVLRAAGSMTSSGTQSRVLLAAAAKYAD